MDTPESIASRHRRRRLAALAIGALGALAMGIVAVTQPPEAWAHLKEMAGRGTEWVRGLGAGWFFAAFAVLPAVGFPVSPFAFGAGPLFGPVLGLPAVLALAGASMAASMTISYGLSRHLLRPWAEKLLAYLGYRVPAVPKDKQRMFVFLVRATPGSPYVFQSYLLGLAGVSFGTYLAVSWLVSASSVALMIIFGDALMKGHGRLALAAAGGVVVVAVLVKLARGRLAARAEAGLAAAAGTEGRGGDGV